MASVVAHPPIINLTVIDKNSYFAEASASVTSFYVFPEQTGSKTCGLLKKWKKEGVEPYAC
jgi:hypothetical protein